MLIKRNFFPDIYRAWRYHSQWRNNWSQSSCYLCWCNCAITKLIPLPSMVYWMSEVPLKTKEGGLESILVYTSHVSRQIVTESISLCLIMLLRRKHQSVEWTDCDGQFSRKENFFYHINYGFRFIDRAPERFLLSVSTNSVTENFVHWKLGHCFCSDSTHIFLSWVR